MDGNKVQALRQQFERERNSASLNATVSSPNKYPTSILKNSKSPSEDSRRNGIYLPNISTTSLKRRPMVLDLHQVCEGEVDEEEEDEEEGHMEDELSISSSSGTNSSLTCVNNSKEEAENEDQAHTPTSSGSGSSSGYGKVKRSNAFRASKDNPNDTTSTTSISTMTPNPSSKIVLERVKSLDTSSKTSTFKPTAERTSSLRQCQPKVNVVTPYQVSDIYTQRNESINNNNNNASSKTSSEAEYAIPLPVISRHGKSSHLLVPNKQPISPPKIPPPPQTSPPSIVGLPLIKGLDPTYSYLTQQSRREPSPINKSSPYQVAPPEKPPRTFLYDILTDRNKKGPPTNNNNNNNNNSTNNSHKNPPEPSMMSQQQGQQFSNSNIQKDATIVNAKRTQYSSSSSSSTLTSASANYRPLQPRPPATALRNISSTATVRQTNSKLAQFKPSSTAVTPPTVPYHHPPLVRSKTESQLIVKKGWENNYEYDYGYKALINAAANQQKQNQANVPATKSRGIMIPKQMSYTYESQQTGSRGMQNLQGQKPKSTSINNLLSYNKVNMRLYPYQHDHGLPTVPQNNTTFSHPYSDKGRRNSPSSYIPSEEMGKPPSVVFQPRFPSPRGSGVNESLNERSKSEWALNQPNSNGGVNLSLSQISPRAGILMNRRNTLSGHASLDSNNSSSSSANANANSMRATPTGPSASAKKQGHGIQQSIQNLVNQLFNSSSSSSTTMKDGHHTHTTGSSTDSGIQLGSESLSSCDTPVGDSTTDDTGDSDCENDGETCNNARQVVEARKGYVRRVSSIRVQELGASINRLIQSSKKSSEPLFECLLVVGLNRDPYSGIYHSYIRDKFPPNTKLPSGVEQFCFPDSLEWPCHEGPSSQFYTLAITDQRGSRKFGCCYRILPEGANICIPITYCIVSSHRAIGFYREVLREITQRHGYSEYQKRFWMEELYKKQFPLTGGNISVSEPAVEDLYNTSQTYGHVHNHHGLVNFSLNPNKTVTIKRRADSRLDETDLVTLLTTCDLAIVIKIFGSLLLERKVVLISRALGTLSLCVEALESMLYPFSWQHTFVPILPLNMTDVLDAPAPFLIGVLKSASTPWDKTLDEGVVVDLDQNKIISCVGDEGTILPKRIHRKLRDALQLVLNLADQKESTKNVLISECFIRMFVETMGHHAQHVVTQQDGKKIFERESFVKSSDSKAIQNFLEWFSETSMFHEFTQLKLKDSLQHGLFEQRVMELFGQNQSQNASNSTPFKNAKNFMKTRPFGNWLKDAFIK